MVLYCNVARTEKNFIYDKDLGGTSEVITVYQGV
jgi:hypothetical protein